MNQEPPNAESMGRDSRSRWVQRMVRLLAFSAEWTLHRYTLRHISGIDLWISNGFWFLSLWRPDVHFSFIEKVRLWSSVRRCMRQCQHEPRCDARWLKRDARMDASARKKLEEMLDEA